MATNYLRFWGVRGSYPAPFETHLKAGGNTSCAEIRIDDHLLILDAGSGIIPLGNALVAQKEIRNMLVILTHYHWDHISGLPFFVPAFVPDWSIKIFGPGKSPAEIKECVSQQMRAPYFPVETETWLANISYVENHTTSLEYGSAKIRYFNVHHPGTTFGYRIETAGKTIVYISDNELLFLDQPIDQRLNEHDIEADERVLLEGMKEEEKMTSLHPMMDADILIHDAQYTPEDYDKKRGWGHSCYLDTVSCAIEARVKHLYLFHLDPNYTDDFIDTLHQKSQELIRARNSDLQCHIAREGEIIDLN